MEEIKKLKSKSLKGYLYSMIKKTEPQCLARAVQHVLELPVTGEFDESTINKLNRLALRSYPTFRNKMKKYI